LHQLHIVALYIGNAAVSEHETWTKITLTQ